MNATTEGEKYPGARNRGEPKVQIRLPLKYAIVMPVTGGPISHYGLRPRDEIGRRLETVSIAYPYLIGRAIAPVEAGQLEVVGRGRPL